MGGGGEGEVGEGVEMVWEEGGEVVEMVGEVDGVGGEVVGVGGGERERRGDWG